ncbi:MAG TPA: Xaa-Pro peptidase family protein [Gaiellaceae bacterium]
MPNLIVAGDSIRNPEIRHEVPLAIPDPFLYLERDGRRVAIVNSLEIGRARALGIDGLEVRALEEFGSDEMANRGLQLEQINREVALLACRELELDSAAAPPTFPLEIADHLRAGGVDVRADRELFEGRRRVKNEHELAGIRRAQAACEAAMDAARDLLRRAVPNGQVLKVDGEPLTSERLKAAIETVFSEHGVSADESIVSHGPQTAVGHNMGSGPIAPGEPIVVDIFPRDRESGCYSDMTRTFVFGEPPEELVRYQRLVKEALDRSLAEIRPGADGTAVYTLVCKLFEEQGFPTQLSKPPGEVLEDGFFHGLGHGVGLEVHEQPNLGRAGNELVAGDVITLEPGLYRKGFGGCRLEDLVLVTEEGAAKITKYPYDLAP